MNSRFWISFLLLILMTRAVISQPWYFNNVYNPNNTWASSLSIIAEEDGYFGTAISDDSTTGYKNICSYKLNLNGDLVFWKNYGIIGSDLYPGNEGSLVKNGENYALFGSRKNWTTTRSSGLFYKFNSTGDTILTRPFTSPVYNTLIGRTCNITSDDGFILLGEVSVGSNYSDVVMIKTDSNGNEQWRTQYGTSIDDNANSIIQTPDGGYALGAWSRIPGQEETADPLVYKTDSLGNEEWHLNLGGPYLDDEAMVCNTMDSCIMVLTGYADSMWTPEYAYARINLVKIDLEGNIIWNKKYGTSKAYNITSNIILLENGNFTACGYGRLSGYLNPVGWLFRFSSNGDSIWYRDYYYYPEDPDYSLNYLYDVSYANDNGFVTVGKAFTLTPPNNVQKMWVIKVDSIGCEIPNCWVGIEEDGKSVRRYEGEECELVIWPNPASEGLSVKVLGLSAGRDGSLVIYDIFGRVALSLPPGGGRAGDGGWSWQVDVSSLPPGIYIAVARDEETIIGTGKFVLAK